ncbi:MAG TPA: FAD-dependent oxidoreductase [Mycobacteriales bacterium]|nr:FAD-dependent oxidoreductase [Mycobacteriales bacterium]
MTNRSLWLDTCGEDLTPRPQLPGDRSADVAIVGAGYTGLWTAHHLLRREPSLRVAVIEREIAGWGASGRNGGWCSALFPGRDPSGAMRRALVRVVDEIGAWCREHDVPYAKGGTLTLARGAAQTHRLGDRDGWLSQDATRARVRVAGASGAVFDPDCAAIHPGMLVRRLAQAVEAQGGEIFEHTAVLDVRPGALVTPHATVRAEVVVQATEGYSCELPGQRRRLAPVRSLVIATEPLPAPVWEEIGWAGRETLTDDRHLIVYAQRSHDDRIVLGGRGAPYRFGSRTDGEVGYARTHAALQRTMQELFPQAAAAAVTHRWGGVLGVPRDWMPSVRFDPVSGIARAGGYVGDGVACSALAGETLADLILGRDTDLTRLPWVGHRSPDWEPEPLRWLGICAMTAAMAAADRAERRTGRSSAVAAGLSRLIGKSG